MLADTRVASRSPITLCESCNARFIPQLRHHPAPLNTNALRANLCPSNADIDASGEQLQNLEAEIQRYAEKLKHIRQVAEQLETEMRLLEQRVKERRYWTSALRRLPAETLENIFDLVCSSEEYSLSVSENGKNVCAPPYTLSNVSSYWRSVISARPHLWRSINIDIYRITKDIAPILQLYLERSKSTSFKIRIWDGGPGYPEDKTEDYDYSYDPDDEPRIDTSEYLSGQGEYILFSLVQAFTRCEELHNLTHYDILSRLYGRYRRPKKLTFPLLTILRNSSKLYRYPQFGGWFWKPLHEAPKLTELHIPRDFVITFDIPYQQITSLTIEEVDLSSLLSHVIARCTSLRDLTIQQLETHVGDNNRVLDNKITSPIQNIYIGMNGRDEVWQSLDGIFNNVVLPSLRSLRVLMVKDYDYGEEDWDGGALNEMLRQSSCSETMKELSLILMGCAVEWTQLEPVLRSCPELTCLELCLRWTSDIDAPLGNETPTDQFLDTFLSKLTVTDDFTKEVFVPNLKRLYVHETAAHLYRPREMTAELAEKIVVMAESRRRKARLTDASLETLGISTADRIVWLPLEELVDQSLEMDWDQYSRLQALKEGGLGYVVDWTGRYHGPFDHDPDDIFFGSGRSDSSEDEETEGDSGSEES
ncbi:hypothetical protein VNI00_009062 [Paramarasmius palmivorus]|uniref:F-box domain-containing protein n=1 Tax=Paramarasmius palmivorus TaxID=297713 RepID=A0AAW0CSF5_9AGAR